MMKTVILAKIRELLSERGIDQRVDICSLSTINGDEYVNYEYGFRFKCKGISHNLTKSGRRSKVIFFSKTFELPEGKLQIKVARNKSKRRSKHLYSADWSRKGKIYQIEMSFPNSKKYIMYKRKFTKVTRSFGFFGT